MTLVFQEARMSLSMDAAFAADVKDHYGKYLGTFQSEHRQVRADVFREGEWLVAHVSFPTGLDLAQVKDKYLGELQSFAKEQGLDGRLRIALS